MNVCIVYCIQCLVTSCAHLVFDEMFLRSAHVARAMETKPPEWSVGSPSEVFFKLRWVRAEVLHIFTDDEGEWVRVKYGRNTTEVHPGDSALRPLQQQGATKGDKAQSLTWRHIVSAVKHEMYPMMAAAIEKCADGADSVDAVLEKLKKKRALSNNEVRYIRHLVERARLFSWNTPPQTPS